MRRGAQLRVAVAIALSGLSVVACSSNSKPTSSASSGNTATTSSVSQGTAASGSPIKVGFICSCSGNALVGVNVPVEQAYKAWASTVNASGGINGHPIQLLTEDDTSKPGTSVSEVESFLGDHVSAIVDNSVVDVAWASSVQAAKVPVVGIITNGAPFISNPDFFPEAQTNDSVLYSVVATAKQAGAKDIATFYCAEAVQCAQATPLVKAAGKQLGVPDIYNQEISATAPNFTADCLAAKQRGLKAVFLVDSSVVNVRVAADCAQQGFNPIYVVEGDGFGLNMVSAPGLKDDTWIESTGVPFFGTSASVQAVNTAMDKQYPGVRKNQNAWSENAVLSWAAGILLEDAVKAGGLTDSGTPSAAEVLKGLYALHGDTLHGMAAPLTFTTGKPHHDDCWFTGRVQNGTAVVTNGGRPSCE